MKEDYYANYSGFQRNQNREESAARIMAVASRYIKMKQDIIERKKEITDRTN